MKRIKVVFDIYKKLEDVLLMGCLFAMGIALFSQVICRYFFGKPILWSEEFARYMQVWITFLGIGYGIRTGSHISMVILYNKFSPILKNVVKIVTNIIMIICFVYFIIASKSFVAHQHEILSSAMQIRMSIVYFVAPVSGFIYMLYSIIDIFSNGKELLNLARNGGIN